MNASQRVGTVQGLWRFPVKSMLGEKLEAVDLGEGGVVGDRAYAIVDRETRKVASAKPRRTATRSISTTLTRRTTILMDTATRWSKRSSARRSSTSGGSRLPSR